MSMCMLASVVCKEVAIWGGVPMLWNYVDVQIEHSRGGEAMLVLLGSGRAVLESGYILKSSVRALSALDIRLNCFIS